MVFDLACLAAGFALTWFDAEGDGVPGLFWEKKFDTFSLMLNTKKTDGSCFEDALAGVSIREVVLESNHLNEKVAVFLLPADMKPEEIIGSAHLTMQGLLAC